MVCLLVWNVGFCDLHWIWIAFAVALLYLLWCWLVCMFVFALVVVWFCLVFGDLCVLGLLRACCYLFAAIGLGLWVVLVEFGFWFWCWLFIVNSVGMIMLSIIWV